MPSLLSTALLLPDMSDKKSPPQKQERPLSVRTPQSENKSLKRKFLVSDSPPQDDDDRKTTPKRKKPLNAEMSPTQGGTVPSLPKVPPAGGITSPRTGPLSERQQMLFLKRMTDDSQDSGSKPTSPQPTMSTLKMTPGDKKVHKRNERGETPLHIAAIKGDIKQTKRLIKAGADVNVTDFAGWTPLHEASNRGWLLVAKQLLKAGANCNVQGLENDTPLHDAAGNGHNKLVELLLKHGANPLQPNKQGKTPVDVAMTPEMKRLLRKEIIASSSDSSSLDEIRSPTSPESNSSLKEDEDVHSSEAEEGGQKNSRVEGNSTASTSSRRALLKSPGSDKLVSPRLFLKIQREQYDEISDRPKDFFSVRVETSECSENKDLASPFDSPVSSVDSDLYDPQLDSTKHKVTPVTQASDTSVHMDSSLTSSSSPHHPGKSKNMLVSSTQSADMDDYDLDSFSKLRNLEPDSQSDDQSLLSSSGQKHQLKIMETQQFSPQIDDSSDGEQKVLPLSQSHSLDRGERSHIPSVDSNHTRYKETLNVSQNNGDSGVVTSYQPSDNSGLKSGAGDSVSVITSSTSCSERTPQNSSNFPRRNSVSALSNVACSSASSNNGGVGDTGNNFVSSSGYKWDLRSTASPRSEDSSNHSMKSDSALASSPAKPESSKETRNSPKVGESDRDSRESRDNSRESRDSRPCSPKVPPLKIIFHPKSSTASSQDSDVAKTNPSKKKLPYVVNPTREQEVESSTPSFVPTASSSTTLLPQEISRSASPSSRPSSRGSNAASLSKESDKGSVSAKDTKDKDGSKEEKMFVDSLSNADSSEQKSELKDRDSVSKPRERDKDSTKDKGSTDGEEAKEKESKPTRTLRSHTQALQQQEKQKQSSQPVTQPVVNKDKEKDKQSVSSVRITSSIGSKDSDKDETGSISRGRTNEEEDLSIHPRKRKLRPKPEPPAPTPEPQISLPSVSYEKPPNPFELFLSIRRQVHSRQRSLAAVAPKPPQGYKDFLLVSTGYVLQGNSASTLSVPMLSPPNSVTGPMRELFVEQEKARYKLALRHLTEREKLVLSKEQELIREHGKAARAQVNQALPFSVCTVLRDEEIYNTSEMDQEEKEKNVRTRYNGRQFLSWLKDLDDKYEKIKENLLMRHHHEAESLFAVQKLDWEWKLKDLSLCDHNTTPVIDDLHVPMVPVSDEFELPST